MNLVDWIFGSECFLYSIIHSSVTAYYYSRNSLSSSGGIATAVPSHGQFTGHAHLPAGQHTDQPPSNIPLPSTNPVVMEVALCTTLQPGLFSGQVTPRVVDASTTLHGHVGVHGPAVQGAGLPIDPTGVVSTASVHIALACQALVHPAIVVSDGSGVVNAQGTPANATSVGTRASNVLLARVVT